MDGITGNIFFENGVRIDYSFDIIELVSSGITEVGKWTKTGDESRLTVRRPVQVSTMLGDEMSLVNKTFKVLLAKVRL